MELAESTVTKAKAKRKLSKERRGQVPSANRVEYGASVRLCYGFSWNALGWLDTLSPRCYR